MTVLARKRTGVSGKSAGQFIGTALLMAAIGVAAFFAADAITESEQATVTQGPVFGSEGRLEADRVIESTASQGPVFGSEGRLEADRVIESNAVESAQATQHIGQPIDRFLELNGVVAGSASVLSPLDIEMARAEALVDHYSAQTSVLPDAEAYGVAGNGTFLDKLTQVHGGITAADLEGLMSTPPDDAAWLESNSKQWGDRPNQPR